MSRPNFDDLPTAKKGSLGEAIVDDLLTRQGFVIYNPKTKGPHAFDRLVHTRDKRRFFAMDIKSKPARFKFGLMDTGINERHYRDYLAWVETTGLDFFLTFVDEARRQIYGNYLAKLSTPYTATRRGREVVYPLFERSKTGVMIVYFPFELMKHLAALPADEADTLKGMNTGSYRDAYQ